MSDPSYAFRGETRLTQASQGNQTHLSWGRLPSPCSEGTVLWVLGEGLCPGAARWPNGEMQGFVDG